MRISDWSSDVCSSDLMAGKYACGVLAERVGIARTIAITEIATGVGIILVLLSHEFYAFFLLPVLGVFLNGTSSAIYGSVGELIDDDKHSRAFGLMYTLGSACGLIAPLAFGILADRSCIPLDRKSTRLNSSH